MSRHNQNALYNTGLFIACAGAAVAAQTAAVVGGVNFLNYTDPAKFQYKIQTGQDAAKWYAAVACCDAAIIAPIIGGKDIWRRFHLPLKPI